MKRSESRQRNSEGGEKFIEKQTSHKRMAGTPSSSLQQSLALSEPLPLTLHPAAV